MLQPENTIETLKARIQNLEAELADLLAKNAEEEEITKKKEEVAKVLFDLSLEYDKVKNYTENKNILEKIVFHYNPKNYVAWNNLGVLYIEDFKNFNKAIECYQKVLEINEEYPEAWSNLGNVYNYLEELEQAKPCFENAKALFEKITFQENQKIIQNNYENFTFKYQNSLIKGSSENQNQFGKENLAFAVKKLAIQNFQSIRNLEIQIPTDAQFVCFLGLNGDGKTSILQALAIGLQGIEEASQLLGRLETKIGVEFLEKTENQIHNLYREEHAWTSLVKCSNTMGYGAKRLAVTDKVREDWKKINPFECLFKHKDEDLLNIERWLLDDYLDKDTETALAKQMMACLQKLMPSVSKVSRKKSRIVYEEFGEELTFLQLSAGNKAIVSLVGDILIRLIEQNPDTENLPDLAGIVLIDELETHLHPKWQKEFPKILSEIFPKVQFIITTHSAICLLGMPPNTAFYKVQRTENEGTTVEKIALDMQNLLPNQILTSILFELDIIPSFNQNVNEIDTATTYQETERRKKLDEKLVELSKKLKS